MSNNIIIDCRLPESSLIPLANLRKLATTVANKQTMRFSRDPVTLDDRSKDWVVQIIPSTTTEYQQLLAEAITGVIMPLIVGAGELVYYVACVLWKGSQAYADLVGEWNV